MISHRSSSSLRGAASPRLCSSQNISIPMGMDRLFSHAFMEFLTTSSSCTCKENCLLRSSDRRGARYGREQTQVSSVSCWSNEDECQNYSRTNCCIVRSTWCCSIHCSSHISSECQGRRLAHMRTVLVNAGLRHQAKSEQYILLVHYGHTLLLIVARFC